MNIKWTEEDTYRKLSSIIDGNVNQFQFEACRYLNDPLFSLRNTWEYNTWLLGRQFAAAQDADLKNPASLNVIKSCIDTLVSKIANNKCRPYFNTVNGSYKTKKLVKQVQQFFDVIYDEQAIHEKVAEAFRQACIFGIGYLYVDSTTAKISVMPSWCVAVLSAEAAYGKPTKCLIKMSRYPTTFIDKSLLDSYVDYVEYSVMYDIVEHKQYIYINGQKVKEMPYNGTQLPIVPIYYNKPVYGTCTTSVVQELEGIQEQIDMVSTKMAAAAELTPANTTYIIEGSNLQQSGVTNRTGNIYPVSMPPGVNVPPVVNVNPVPMDPMWQSLLDYYIKQAYEMIGVSQLSAQAKKPSGLDSGVSIQTMQDVESDRFQTQTDHYVQAYVDLAKLLIDCVDENMEILPGTYSRVGLKWKEIKKQANMFEVQYSAATSLSKDPSEKLKQVLQLSQIGLIGPDKIADYLDTPDLEKAYSGAQAVSNGIDQVIERAIESGQYNIPEFINYEQLAQRIAITENELFASLSDDKKNNKDVELSLTRIQTLEDNLLHLMQAHGFVKSDEDNEEEALTSESGISMANTNNAIKATAGSAGMAQIMDAGQLQGGATEANPNMSADQANVGNPAL